MILFIHLKISYLAMVAGERIFERVEPVEDTKANSGEAGCLVITNLRILWFSRKTAKLNLSEFVVQCLLSVNFFYNFN